MVGLTPEFVKARVHTQIGGPHLPRCKAKTRRTGEPCTQIAVKGRNLCRFHGGFRLPKGKEPERPRGKTRRREASRQRQREWSRILETLDSPPRDLARHAVWRLDLDKRTRARLVRAWEAYQDGDGRAWRELVRRLRHKE